MDQGGQDRDRKVGIRPFKEKGAFASICGASDFERPNSNLTIDVFWKANGQQSKFAIYVSCVRYVFSHKAKLQISSQYCAEYSNVFFVDSGKQNKSVRRVHAKDSLFVLPPGGRPKKDNL